MATLHQIREKSRGGFAPIELLIGLTISIILIAGFLIFRQQTQRPSPIPSPTPTTAATVARPTTPTESQEPSPSPIPVSPQSKIAFVRDGDIWLINSDGSEEERVLDFASVSYGPIGKLSWSPTGNYLVFARFTSADARISQEFKEGMWPGSGPRTGRLSLYNVKKDNLTDIEAPPPRLGPPLEWTMDEKLVYLGLVENKIAGYGLVLYDPFSRNYQILEHETDTHLLAGSGVDMYSEAHVGGNVLIFTALDAETLKKEEYLIEHNLYLLNLDTRETNLILNLDEEKVQIDNPDILMTFVKYTGMDLSPDGTKIVYEKIIGGLSEIWLINSDGSNNRKILEAHYWSLVEWLNDSKRIFIRSTSTSSSHTIYHVDTEEIETPQNSNYQDDNFNFQKFAGGGFTISSDDRYIAYTSCFRGGKCERNVSNLYTFNLKENVVRKLTANASSPQYQPR